MCFPDFPEGLAPPTLQRLVTDDPFERQNQTEVEEPVYDVKAKLVQEEAEPAWYSQQTQQHQQSWMQCDEAMQAQMQPYPMQVPFFGEMPLVLMPVFMVPVPMLQPRKAEQPLLKKAITEPTISGETYTVRNTFIHVDEARAPAAQRSKSSPPNFLRMRHPKTTVCLRNLPNRTQQIRLEAHLETLGFDKSAEALHMPLDRKTGVNKGYAFIKFVDEDTATDFMACVEGTQIRGSHSSKRLTACFAARQGPAFLVNLPSKAPALCQ